MSNINSVKVRMYRHGFGDCFLLRFYADATRTFTMLIDCGLKLRDSVPDVSMTDVVGDIKKVLNGNMNGNGKPKLDVLVVTHEHWDHVSGFHPDGALFDDFEIGKIWMAWTESPDDKEAVQIRRHVQKCVKALKLANEKLKNSESAKPGFYDTAIKGEELAAARANFGHALEKVTEFFGPLSVNGATTESGIRLADKYTVSLDTRKALKHVKSLAKGDSGIEYFYPGDLIHNKPKLPGVRIYVLGPPKSALLNKDRPSGGKKKEVYFGMDNYALMGFVNGLLSAGDFHWKGGDESSPFADVETIPVEDAAKDSRVGKSYFDPGEAWRTIDEDWLNMAGALAMQLDSDTNNTSLALAIELVDSGKVLLFPGDAQVGNWLSWHEQEWQVGRGSDRQTVRAKDLLQRTVLYKAGHHLSHNATLEALGLELMNSEELVTLIPEKDGQYNGIPYKPLIDRVRQKTRGRFVFSADSNHPAEEVVKKKPSALSTEEWKAFKKNLKVERLFVEYTINA